MIQPAAPAISSRKMISTTTPAVFMVMVVDECVFRGVRMLTDGAPFSNALTLGF